MDEFITGDNIPNQPIPKLTREAFDKFLEWVWNQPGQPDLNWGPKKERAMSQWVKVKSGYINLAQATDIHVAYSKEPGIEGVVYVSVYQLGEQLWSGQSERPDGYEFDPDGMMQVLLHCSPEWDNVSVWIAPQD